MPRVSRTFLKLSLVYLVLALGAAAGLRIVGEGWFARLFPTYLHIFVVGWITQVIFGVALWFFPKKSRENPRGWDALSWACLITLNLGLVLRVVCEPLPHLIDGSTTLWRWGIIASALLQWVGGVSFVINIWPRVKGRGSRGSG